MAETENSSAVKRLRISKLKVFLIALSYSYVTKSLALIYSRSVITQIERRFNIPSSVVGVIDGSFDIGNLLAICFVSYFGAKSHRPRVIAAGCLIMFLGGCLTALPHFIMRQYQYDRTRGVSTNSTSPAQLCLANQSHASEPSEGIIQTISIAGPFLGSLMAAFFTQIYVDIGFVNLDDVTLGLADARWVGAWWLGFLISAVLNLLAAVSFWFLPKSLPKEGEEDQPEEKETLQPLAGEKSAENPEWNQKAIEFLHFLKNLLGNRVYVLFLVVTVVQFSAFVGFFSFMPKYVEQQYGKSASEAIFLIGVYNLPIICVGYFLGGFFMKKFKISTFLAAKIGFWSSVLEYLIYFAAFAMVCRNTAVAGLTITYDGVEETSYLDNLRSDCNANCDCPTDIWDPVCGENGVSYVSACLAGCDYSTGWGQDTVFRNCSCIPGFNSSAVLGQCPREGKCDTMLLYFMILSFVCCLIYSFGAMPGYMVLIRSLKPEEKAFGLGLHLLAARALGGIPSPIYYGALIDTTCIKWGTTSCGEPGACRMYDSDAYRYIYFAVPATLRFISYIPCVFILTKLKRDAARDESAVSERREEETEQ